MIINKLLALIFSLMILCIPFLIKRSLKTYIFPLSIFSLFWFLFTFIPLILVWGIPINPFSVLFILVCNIVFFLSSFFFDWGEAFDKNKNKLLIAPSYLESKFLLKVCYLFFFISMICFIFDIYINNFTISDFIFNFFESSNKYRGKRIYHTMVSSVFKSSLNIFNYSLVILGAIIFPKFKKKSLPILIIFIPSILITLCHAAKGTIVLSIVLFYGGIFINKIYKNDFEFLDKKFLKQIVPITFALFIILVIVFISHEGMYKLDSNLVVLSNRLKHLKYCFLNYSCAHIYAFSDWFSFYTIGESIMTYKETINHSWGLYTFTPIFEIFKEVNLPIGTYSEYFTYNNIITSNIYTIFRGCILDFGILGCIIFWFFAGLICNIIYYCLLSCDKPYFSICLFPYMLGFFYTSFGISILIWKSIYASAFLLFVIFFLNDFYFRFNQKK